MKPAQGSQGEGSALAVLAEEPKKKKQRQTTIAWEGITQIATEATNGQLAAALQVPAARSGRPRREAESRGQRQITDWSHWTTVREKTKARHAKRSTKGTGRARRRQTSRRQTTTERSGAETQGGGRDGAAALSRTTMREKD